MRYKFKTKPYPHQVVALKRLLKQRGGGLQVPMRWGKSKVGVDFASAMHSLEGVRRVLVITVTSGLGVWEDEVEKHCPLPVWRVFDHNAELVRRNTVASPDLKTPPLDFMVVNFQNVYYRHNMGGRSWAPILNPTLKKFDADLVIVDESHHIGNPTAVQSKFACELGRSARFRVIMTGSMFHRKPFYVFGQAKFYDDGARLGSSFTNYKKRIAIFGGYGGYEVMRYRNLKWMTNAMKEFVHMEKYVPPRPPVLNVLHYNLTGKGLEYYDEMMNESIITVKGENIMAEIVLTKHLRLQQICGGFIKLPDSGKIVQISDDKINLAEDRLSEYWEQGIEKAVIGCRFIPELRALAQLGKRIGYNVVLFHGGVPKGKERSRRIRLFQESKHPTLFISQLSAGKESIDLSAASTMMFYSLSESYVEHDQFSKRIELFKDKRTLMYDFLVAPGTADEITYEALQQKKDVAEFIASRPKYVERITRHKKLAAKSKALQVTV